MYFFCHLAFADYRIQRTFTWNYVLSLYTEFLSCRVKPGTQKLEKISQIESFLYFKA